METCVNNRLVKFLESIKDWYNGYHGYRKNINTQVAVTDLITNIKNKVDKGLSCVSASLYLKQASDTVNHRFLSNILQSSGTGDTPLAWFNDYLSGRIQYVFVNNLANRSSDITCGVFHGSILEPTLFLVYINFLSCLALKGQLQIYADEQLFISAMIKIYYRNKLLTFCNQ